jgi:hypothetical protein
MCPESGDKGGLSSQWDRFGGRDSTEDDESVLRTVHVGKKCQCCRYRLDSWSIGW